MSYNISYDDPTNTHQSTILMQHGKKRDMILVDVESTVNDIIIMLNNIFPHVISFMIIEYSRPYYIFALTFYHYPYINYSYAIIEYSGFEIAYIYFNIVNNSLKLRDTVTTHYLSYSSTNIICKSIIKATELWLSQIKN